MEDCGAFPWILRPSCRPSRTPCGRRWGDLLTLNQGLLGYCSRFVEGSVLAQPFLLPNRPSAAFLSLAVRLLLLDQFLFNHDRQVDNENALLFENELVAIDHGDALAGLDRAGETGGALALKTVLGPATSRHFLFGWLRRHTPRIDWKIIVSIQPPPTSVGALLAAVPEELGLAELNHGRELYSRLRPFLLTRLRVLPDLIQNLRTSLENP